MSNNPSPYRICRYCIMDTSDPMISFNEQGDCYHCTNMRKLIAEQASEDLRKTQLDTIIHQIKKEGASKEYDCIIGLSGGVDSSYLLYKAKEWGLRPLVVHVDGGWNSELAVKNIEELVNRLHVDLFTIVINWEEMKDLQRAFFEAALANQDIPQDHAFFAGLYAFATKHHIRYVLSGSNLATEAIMPSSWAYNAMDLRHLKAVHTRFGKQPLHSYPTVNFFQYYIYYPLIKRMKVIKPLNFIDYKKQDAMALLQTLGWRYYGGKHFESRFTKFQQAYYRPTKFGYDERRAYLSNLIVNKEITREQALQEMNQAVYTPQTLDDDITYVCKKLGLTKEQFEHILQKPNKTFADYPSNAWLFELKNKIKTFIK